MNTPGMSGKTYALLCPVWLANGISRNGNASLPPAHPPVSHSCTRPVSRRAKSRAWLRFGRIPGPRTMYTFSAARNGVHFSASADASLACASRIARLCALLEWPCDVESVGWTAIMEEDVQGSQETSERVSRAIFLSLTPPLDGADARGPFSSRYSALPLASTPSCQRRPSDCLRSFNVPLPAMIATRRAWPVHCPAQSQSSL
jgi:hypothetical protein